MSGVFGQKKTNAPPSYTSLALQTSAYGLPVPVVYGTARVGGNLGFYDGFQATAHTSSQSGKGGGAPVSVTYTYSVNAAFFLCEGPIHTVNAMWSSQTIVSPASQGLSVFTGFYGQAPWAFLQSNYPNQALGYSGVAYVAASPLQLGNSASLPNFNYEVAGILFGSAPGWDADPSRVAQDLLTNPYYGAGFPAARVGAIETFSEVHTVPATAPYTVTVNNPASFAPNAIVYAFNLDVIDPSGAIYTCVAANPQALQYDQNGEGVYGFSAAQAGQNVTIRYAAVSPLGSSAAAPAAATPYQAFAMASGLWISPAYTQQAQAASMLGDIATYTHAEWVWSSGVLTLVPRGTVNVTANGYTYTAPAEPLFSLTDDDFLPNQAAAGSSASSADDPVILSRQRPADQNNTVQLEYLDRGNQYAASVIEASDQALIARYGRRSKGNQQAHLFADIHAATTAAQLLLQQEYIRNTYAFTVDQRYCVLDPMDIVAITDAALGLNQQWVLITEITENDDGTLSIIAEEYPAGTGAAASYSVNQGQGHIPNYNVAPSAINPPIIFDAPLALCRSNGLEVWAAVSGSNPATWGGCAVWISLDGSTYQVAATVDGPARMGVLSAALAGGSDPDTANILAVDLTQSQAQLAGGTQADADVGATLCYVDGEYVSYETATLTAPYHYNLGTYLRRGQHGSAISAHPAGGQFARLDDAIVKVPISQAHVGKTIYLKFQSLNIYNEAAEDLASLAVYTHDIGGPPNSFRIGSPYATGSLTAITLSWVNPTGTSTTLAAVEVWRATVGDITKAVHAGDAAYPATTYVDGGLTSGTLYYYWLRCRDMAGTFGPWTEVITGTSTQVQTGDLGNGAVTPAKFQVGTSPIVGVAALPDPTNYIGPPVVLLASDGQLYRYASGAWTAGVPAQNISGGITAQQIAPGAITAAQLAINSLIGGALGSNPVGTGAIGSLAAQSGAVTAEQIAQGAVTAQGLASGAVEAVHFASGLSPVQIVATLPSPTGYSGPVVVFNEADGQLYRYANGAWTAGVPAANISGTLTTNQLGTGIVTAAQFAAGLSPVVAVASLPSPTGYTGAPVVFNTGDGQLYRYASGAWTAGVPAANVLGQLTDAQLAAISAAKLTGQITGTQIANGAISTPQLSAGAVTAAQIAAGTVTAKQIAAGAVTATQLAAGSVTASQLAAGAVTANAIQSGAITTAALSAGAVTAATIAAGTITSNQLAAGSVTASQLAVGAVTANAIAAGAVTAGAVAANAISSNNIAAGAIQTTNLAAGAVTTAAIAAGAVTATQIAAGTITATQLAAGSVTSTQLAAGSVTASAIVAGAISANAVAANAINAANVVPGSIGDIENSYSTPGQQWNLLVGQGQGAFAANQWWTGITSITLPAGDGVSKYLITASAQFGMTPPTSGVAIMQYALVLDNGSNNANQTTATGTPIPGTVVWTNVCAQNTYEGGAYGSITLVAEAQPTNGVTCEYWVAFRYLGSPNTAPGAAIMQNFYLTYTRLSR